MSCCGKTPGIFDAGLEAGRRFRGGSGEQLEERDGRINHRVMFFQECQRLLRFGRVYVEIGRDRFLRSARVALSGSGGCMMSAMYCMWLIWSCPASTA